MSNGIVPRSESEGEVKIHPQPTCYCWIMLAGTNLIVPDEFLH